MASEPTTLPALAPERAGTTRWAILALLMAISGSNYFNRISMPIAGDARVMAQYDIAPTTMGWVYSAFLIAYTISMIPGGWFIDRFGAKAALMLVTFGSSGFVALTGAVGLVTHDGRSALIALLAVRALMGIVSAPIYPAGARVVGSWFPKGSRSLANGLITGTALVGIAATPPVFGTLIAYVGWPTAFLIAAVATAGVGLVWTLCAVDHPDAQVDHAPAGNAAALADWGALLRNRSLVLLTISYAAIGYFQYLFFYWMNYYFQEVLALPDGTSRIYAAIPPLAMAVGMPLGGWISDLFERARGARWGRRIVPMAGMGAGALLLACGVLARDPAWIVTWFALALAAVGAAEGPFWATAVGLGGRRGGSAGALFNAGGNVGGSLAPVITPWVGQHCGWPWSVALGSVVCLAGVVLWLGIDPTASEFDSDKTVPE